MKNLKEFSKILTVFKNLNLKSNLNWTFSHIKNIKTHHLRTHQKIKSKKVKNKSVSYINNSRNPLDCLVKHINRLSHCLFFSAPFYIIFYSRP